MKKILTALALTVAATSVQAADTTLTKLQAGAEMLQTSQNAADVNDYSTACFYAKASQNLFVSLLHTDNQLAKDFYELALDFEKDYCK